MDDVLDIARRVGERIRVARHSKGMTLGALGQTTDLSTAFLSRLERGEASTSIANLIRISTALGVSLGDMFGEDADDVQPQSYVLVKRRPRKSGSMMSAAGYKYERLGGDLPGQRLDAFELEFPIGSKHPILLVAHEGEEVLLLLSGRIEFQVGANRFVMEKGDCLHFDAEQPHMGRNIGSKPARMLMVVSPSRPAGSQFDWWNAPETTEVTQSRPSKDEAKRAVQQLATSKRRHIKRGGSK